METLPEDSFVARLQFLRGSESGRAFANRVGIPNATMQKYLDGTATPGLDNFLLIARKTGVTLDWLASNEGPMRHSGLPEPIHYGDGMPEGYVLIPRLPVQPSAGAGSLAIQGEGPDFLPFHEQWLRRLGVAPRNARLMIAKGDSMYDTIWDGDPILVDVSIREVVDEAIYVLVYGGLVILKRIQMLRNGGLMLVSDNPKYRAEELKPHELPELIVEGRVKWGGRAL